jgi:hypothetical protein
LTTAQAVDPLPAPYVKMSESSASAATDKLYQGGKHFDTNSLLPWPDLIWPRLSEPVYLLTYKTINSNQVRTGGNLSVNVSPLAPVCPWCSLFTSLLSAVLKRHKLFLRRDSMTKKRTSREKKYSNNLTFINKESKIF